jgi:hypothetical protein
LHNEEVNNLHSSPDIIGWSYERGPVTVAERSETCAVFARSEDGIVGSNVFILYLCCPLFR